MKSSTSASQVIVSMSLPVAAMAFVTSRGGNDEPLWLRFAVLGVGIVLLLAAIISLVRRGRGEKAPE